MVAHLHLGHALPERLDDARPLVAEHGRERVRGCTGDHVPVAVADAARGEPHRHLAWPWVGGVDVLDAQRSVDLAEDGGAHCADSTSTGSGTLDRCG